MVLWYIQGGGNGLDAQTQLFMIPHVIVINVHLIIEVAVIGLVRFWTSEHK